MNPLLSNDGPSRVNRDCNLVFKHRQADGLSDDETYAIAAAMGRFNEARAEGTVERLACLVPGTAETATPPSPDESIPKE